jgi:hypothetical protein
VSNTTLANGTGSPFVSVIVPEIWAKAKFEKIVKSNSVFILLFFLQNNWDFSFLLDTIDEVRGWIDEM